MDERLVDALAQRDGEPVLLGRERRGGNGRLLGIAAWLGYMSAVLIVCSMCAVSFGDYAVSLFVSDGGADWWDNVFASAIVVAMAFVVFFWTFLPLITEALTIVGSTRSVVLGR